MTLDRQRFEELYRVHAPSVRRRAVELLGSEAEAAEVVQDLFLSMLERPQQFANKSSLTTFLYSATTHACLNRLRNQRNRARLLALHGAAAHDRHANPRAERVLQLRALLRELPDELAAVAVYHYLDEMTYDEIAALLGCSRRHVGTLLSRLAQLRGAQPEEACPAS
ncbi:MAG TPA: sigma-70 family RNA polymerase sigma factor [Polyangiales bacterium]|nr:sigma-70 family RNA polymerase sigma factor [Polyangiales bacterium]